jgi:hypothetical protein
MSFLRLLLIPALALGLAACASETAPDASDTDPAADSSSAAATTDPVEVGAAPAADATFLLASDIETRAAELDGQEIAVEGTISEVCQEAGCWLTLQNANGTPFRVVVPKDEAGEYVFTFPKDVSGAQVRLAGTFSVEEESVETLRHLAEDAGESPEAIEAITEPKRTLVLTASGGRVIPVVRTASVSAGATVRDGGERCGACPMKAAPATVNA